MNRMSGNVEPDGYNVGLCMCGFCNMWVFDNCVRVLVVRVLVFIAFRCCFLCIFFLIRY